MITILGGGIAGLLAAYVLRDKRPLLLEAAPKLGGNFLAGGLKYIRYTHEAAELLRELGIPWTERKPRGMIHIGGVFANGLPGATIAPHPEFLNAMTPDVRLMVMANHWVKTRGTTDGFRADCMNDPGGNGADMMMECDLAAVLDCLISRAEEGGAILRRDVKILSIEPDHVRTQYAMLAHDVLVPTIPLAALSKLAPWADLPNASPRPLGIVEWMLPSTAQPEWDYMYNPFTPGPGMSASRYTWPRMGVFQAEVPGVGLKHAWPIGRDEVMRDITCEARIILKQWWGIMPPLSTDHRVIPGHLTPLAQPLVWPSNWYPLGRFTQWEPRATSERVLADALKVRAAL
jgi:hypothetical protein